MTRDPRLVPRDALRGCRIAISVSDSPDLARLGLDPAHLVLTIAELTRAVVLAGGIVVYGGRINEGFTRVVVDESERYGQGPVAFEHYVPYSEHTNLSEAELDEYEASLGVKSVVRLVGADGTSRSIRETSGIGSATGDVAPPAALTTMRELTSKLCDGRVIVGGQLAGYTGAMPGILEEALLTLVHRKPLYVAGGFGGAATLVGQLITPDLYSWLPEGMPPGVDFDAERLVSDALRDGVIANGLDAHDSALLAQTNRPSDIATLAILGMSRWRATAASESTS